MRGLMLETPIFSIVVVAFNSNDHLQGCLNHLAEQDFSAFEAIIVDNNCPQGSTQNVSLPDGRFRVVSSTTNLGFAGGANLGADAASADWVVMLNPDTIVRPDWLHELHLAILRFPQYSVFGSTILSMDDPTLIDSFGDVYSIYGVAWQGGHGASVEALPREDKIVFGASGAAACYRRDVFRALRGFDERFFCYLEDVDLSFRLLNAGYNCLQVRKALVEHAGSVSSSGQEAFPILQTYRNGFRVIIKNASLVSLPVLLVLHILTQSYIILRNAKSPGTWARLRGFVGGIGLILPCLLSRCRPRHDTLHQVIGISKLTAWRPKSLSDHTMVYRDVPQWSDANDIIGNK
ncbi:MAG: glycosyltransferase family 2 protein [Pseudomonadota bacterium]